jgi:cell division protein FtsB
MEYDMTTTTIISQKARHLADSMARAQLGYGSEPIQAGDRRAFAEYYRSALRYITKGETYYTTPSLARATY